MGQVHLPPPVTPLAALLYARDDDCAALRPQLEQLLGPCEMESPVHPFTFTDYYRPTMGGELKRRFLVFARLADAGELAGWKLATNELEARLAQVRPAGGPLRPVNVDPGYLTSAKLVLASTKDFAHRIYLRDGIFAEITLSWRGGKWVKHAHTFPDFASGTYDDFLAQARQAHMRRLKSPP
jgi:hypothetical protein